MGASGGGSSPSELQNALWAPGMNRWFCVNLRDVCGPRALSNGLVRGSLLAGTFASPRASRSLNPRFASLGAGRVLEALRVPRRHPERQPPRPLVKPSLGVCSPQTSNIEPPGVDMTLYILELLWGRRRVTGVPRCFSFLALKLPQIFEGPRSVRSAARMTRMLANGHDIVVPATKGLDYQLMYGKLDLILGRQKIVCDPPHIYWPYQDGNHGTTRVSCHRISIDAADHVSKLWHRGWLYYQKFLSNSYTYAQSPNHLLCSCLCVLPIYFWFNV